VDPVFGRSRLYVVAGGRKPRRQPRSSGPSVDSRLHGPRVPCRGAIRVRLTPTKAPIRAQLGRFDRDSPTDRRRNGGHAPFREENSRREPSCGLPLATLSTEHTRNTPSCVAIAQQVARFLQSRPRQCLPTFHSCTKPDSPVESCGWFVRRTSRSPGQSKRGQPRGTVAEAQEA